MCGVVLLVGMTGGRDSVWTVGDGCRDGMFWFGRRDGCEVYCLEGCDGVRRETSFNYIYIQYDLKALLDYNDMCDPKGGFHRTGGVCMRSH